MKLKAFFAVFVMLTTQSMHALQIVFVNKWYGSINARIDIISNGSGWSENIKLNPQESHECNYQNTRTIGAIKISCREFKWRMSRADLTAHNIPVTGNHSLMVFMNNLYGRFAITVDGGAPIVVEGTAAGTNPTVAAAAA